MYLTKRKMSQIDYFKIVLNKPDHIYFCGEKVTGNVILKINERLKCQGISCRITGKALVYW